MSRPVVLEATLDEGIEFRAGDIGDVSWVADQSDDVVFTSNVLEHLSHRDHMVRARKTVS
jgi:2-polyprenyl-3-methyl-5-hydroxy-6-metoxy-1,4-benzoquinol methylase